MSGDGFGSSIASEFIRLRNLVDNHYPEFQDERVFRDTDSISSATYSIAVHVGFRKIHDWESIQVTSRELADFIIDKYKKGLGS